MQTEQSLLLKQLYALHADSGFIVGARRAFVEFRSPLNIAALAMKIAICFKNPAAEGHEIEKLATLKRATEMLFASCDFPSI